MMNHKQSQESLAGYVLGALDEREQEELLEHVQSCLPCFRKAQEHLEVASLLAGGIVYAEAPASLRNRILTTYAQRPVELLSSLVKMRIWSSRGKHIPSASNTTRRWVGSRTRRPKA